LQVYQNFQRMCTSLQAHEQIFAIFPSESLYTSVLSGSLACIVQASVNHSSIAETLSQSVADISEKVARCAIYLEVTPTLQIKKLVTAMYSTLFTFYRDVLKWYMSSSTSKFLGSLNANIKPEFEKSVQAIEDLMTRVRQDGALGELAMVRLVLQSQGDLEAKMDAQRAETKLMCDEIIMRQRQLHQEISDIDVGAKVVDSLGQVFNAMTAGARQRPSLGAPKQTALIEDIDEEAGDVDRVILSDQEMDQLAQRLMANVIGTEGSSLLAHGRYARPQHITTLPHRLRSTLLETNKSRTLWILEAYSRKFSVNESQTLALAFVAAAWQEGAALLSHFCCMPRTSSQDADITAEQRGVLGLTYSLARQLLQFRRPEGKQIDLAELRAHRYQADLTSWENALGLLRQLLAATPGIRFCLIQGLNTIESDKGASWLRCVMDILLQYQQQSVQPFHLLLVTHGQSRFLGKIVAPGDRHIIQDAEVG
jgi:hypothetical protein